MHPFYFGSGARRLLGIYDPSSQTRSGRRAALVCYPWGPEYLHAHRSLRQLTRQLAEAGVDAMRFDYFATGDSGGDDTEGDLAGWRQDIATAADELVSLSGATRLTLIGMRLGATLAAAGAAAGIGHPVERLVLWDPVLDGAEHLRELQAQHLASERGAGERKVPSPARDGSTEILGFPLTARLQQELPGVSLQAIASAIPCPVNVVASTSSAACERIRSVLASVGALELRHIDSPPVWIEDWPRQSGFVPTKILQQIVEWVAT